MLFRITLVFRQTQNTFHLGFFRTALYFTEMEESNERTTLLENGDRLTSSSMSSITEIRFKVYKRRWYVLFVFTANAYVYNMAWNTWAPIQEPTKLAFGWTDFDILLLS